MAKTHHNKVVSRLSHLEEFVAAESNRTLADIDALKARVQRFEMMMDSALRAIGD